MSKRSTLPALAGTVAAELMMMSGAAFAQSTSWYVSPDQTPTYEGLTSLNSVVNSAPAFTNLPISFDIGGMTGQISFSGGSMFYAGSTVKNADGSIYAGNFLSAASGSATLSFDTQQRFFSMRWGSVDPTNLLSFYNGDQLLLSVSGSQALASRTASSSNGSYDAGFAFGDVGFTRVVATGTIPGAFEFGNLAASDVMTAPAVAPAPLNAASLGGLMSFLLMLNMWGKGGMRHTLRLSFAFSGPRRRMAGVA